MAKKVDRDPEWESQRQCDAGKTPGGEEFSDHRFGHAYRQRQEQLDGPALAPPGPQPQQKCGEQEEKEQRMQKKKGLQAGLPALKKIAKKNRHPPRHDQKYDDEHVSERGSEIA